MDVRTWYQLNLVEYEGRVLDGDSHGIEERLSWYEFKIDSNEFWLAQAGMNHEHPADDVDQDWATHEMQVMRWWKEQMQVQMPHRSFVIEVSCEDRMTWYEVMRGAPTQDEDWTLEVNRRKDLTDEEFRAVALDGFDAIQDARVAKFARHNPRACPECEVEAGFSEPTIDPVHRGLQWKTCLHCEAQILHATRVIREVVHATADAPPGFSGGRKITLRKLWRKFLRVLWIRF